MGNFNISGKGLVSRNIPNLIDRFVFRDIFLYDRWICPMFEYAEPGPIWAAVFPNSVLQVLEEGGEKVHTKNPRWWTPFLWGDFSRNYTALVGYTLKYRARDIPFDVNIGVNYEWRGLCVAEGGLAGLHRSSGVVPSIGLSWRIGEGNVAEREFRPGFLLVDGKVSYLKTLYYNDPLQLGNNALNDGIRFSVGVAVGDKAGSVIGVKYELDCFDYFNLPNISFKQGKLMLYTRITRMELLSLRR